MSVRWTLRKSGDVRTTIRVEHHLSAEQVAGCLAYKLDLVPDQVPENPSQHWLIENARDLMWAYGDAFEGNIVDLYGTDVWADAKTKVAAAFPDLRAALEAS